LKAVMTSTQAARITAPAGSEAMSCRAPAVRFEKVISASATETAPALSASYGRVRCPDIGGCLLVSVLVVRP